MPLYSGNNHGAPGCFIVADRRKYINDPERSELIQTDYDYPGLAGRFGWSVADLKSPTDHKCKHSCTDGTIDCRDCGLGSQAFISAAYTFLTKKAIL